MWLMQGTAGKAKVTTTDWQEKFRRSDGFSNIFGIMSFQ